MKTTPMTLRDPPSCAFLKENIADERKAIETYMEESSRTDDTVLKRVFHATAIDEMNHLELLERMAKDLGCEH